MTIHNAALVKRFMKCASNPDAQSLALVIADDCEIMQSSIHPYTGTYCGVAGAVEFFRILRETYKLEALDLIEIYENDARDALVLEFALRGSNRLNGARFDTTVQEKWRIADGKIAEIRPHWFEPPNKP